MARDITNQVHYYYDFHPTEEDLMGETSWHTTLIDYLKAVLVWLFRGQACTIYDNLNFYQTLAYMEYPVAPDLAVLKGVAFEHVRSWTVGRSGPAPQVVFEILSEETWKKDVREKPTKYASMGVQEYFAYDPYEPPIRRGTTARLYGWRLDAQRGEMVAMTPNAAGWLWSDQLQCWLVPDQTYLRLYDRHHQLCLTGEEAQAMLAEEAIERAEEEAERAEEEARRAEEEARRAQEATRRAEEEARRAQEATRRAEEEARRAQEAMKRAEEEARRVEEATRQTQALAEKLRSLGINPDEVA
jgi:Uma2 family endonuclease